MEPSRRSRTVICLKTRDRTRPDYGKACAITLRHDLPRYSVIAVNCNSALFFSARARRRSPARPRLSQRNFFQHRQRRRRVKNYRDGSSSISTAQQRRQSSSTLTRAPDMAYQIANNFRRLKEKCSDTFGAFCYFVLFFSEKRKYLHFFFAEVLSLERMRCKILGSLTQLNVTF